MPRAWFRWWQWGLMGLLLLSQPSTTMASSRAQLTQIDIVGNTLRIHLNKRVGFHAFTLREPDRYVIDLARTQDTLSWRHKRMSHPWVQTCRAQPRGALGARIVLDLSHAPPRRLKPYFKQLGRHRVELRINLKPSAPKHTLHTHLKRLLHPRALSDLRQPTKKEVTIRPLRIVIDPGHGGKDSGARGRHHVYEKQVVLAIAKQLAHELRRQPGVAVYLTRSDDRYIGLRERLHLARRYRADLFVAIHADAYLHARAHGASVYALSNRGATSEAARWLAEKENTSEFMGGAKLDIGSRMLKSVLLDLQQTATIASSLDMGYDILQRMGRFAHLHHKDVEQAAFVVLKSPDIPSLLVETGFLSNPREAKRLNAPAYQQQLAHAIAEGIMTFFKQRPPRDTLLWARKHHPFKTIYVHHGDTLYGLARRYHSSVGMIARVNGLAHGQLSVGQALLVPR